MLPKAIDIDFEALGQQMIERKKRLNRDGIPSDAEHAMVAGAKGGGDTPATTARQTKSARRAARAVQVRTKSRAAKSSSSSQRLRMRSKSRRKAVK
jgi:hypothetical protein